MSVAIVATIRSWNQEALDWARYHEAIGFERQYVFIDDGIRPDNRGVAGIQVKACDRDYWAGRSDPPFGELLDSEHRFGTVEWGQPQFVMVRQVLNAQMALERARREGVSWLLHLDSDELFWSPRVPVTDHFAQLERMGIAQARYLNRESVVVEGEEPSLFGRGRLYKQNEAALSAAQRAAADRILEGRPYFVSYSNGKSAVKVDAARTVSGVHAFEIIPGRSEHCVLTTPAILHHPYGAFDAFRRKHTLLGVFDATSFFGEHWNPPPMLVRAQRYLRDGDEGPLRDLYQSTIVHSREMCADLVRHRIVEAIDLGVPPRTGTRAGAARSS